MSLKDWETNGWLSPHSSSRQEVNNLFEIVKRDLNDAGQSELSADWRFGIAYNAALKLCTILLFAEGYRPVKTLAHYRTIRALPIILGKEKEDDADYLDSCRTKRNTLEYDRVGGTTCSEADDLLDYVLELKQDVIDWLKKNHKDLL